MGVFLVTCSKAAELMYFVSLVEKQKIMLDMPRIKRYNLGILELRNRYIWDMACAMSE